MVEKQILKEQVRQLYALAPLGFVATVMNSVIVFVVMREVAPASLLLPWLAAVLVITGLRGLLVARFRRTDLDRDDPATWSRRFTASLVAVGLAWGCIGLVPFTFSLAHQVFLAFVLGGMAAGASSTFSKIRHGFAAFSIPTLVPLALHFLLLGDNFHLAMALMTLLFLVLLGKISRHNYGVNRTSLLLRFENREMIETLKRAKDDVDVLNLRLMEEIKAKEVAEAELRLYHGQLERTVEERTADLLSANEKLRSEIEERKQIEAALQQAQEKLTAAKDAAEAGSVAKSEFLANMSHEMRTPLAGTLGMIGLVLDTEIGSEERQLLEMAKRSSESLLRIIDDVLDFSRIEAGKMRFERKRFRVRQVVATAVEVVSLSAVEKGLGLSWEVDDAVQEVEGDEGRLRQVLINLLGNAVKFTEKGSIDLTVSRAPAEGGDFLLFTVRDTGVGISADQLESIFGKFTQIDSSLTRKYGGTGLGLALSRQIVEKLGGKIWAESAVGAGSTLHFTLPAELPPAEEQPPR
jgi:signal transduction histidine kinase